MNNQTSPEDREPGSGSSSSGSSGSRTEQTPKEQGRSIDPAQHVFTLSEHKFSREVSQNLRPLSETTIAVVGASGFMGQRIAELFTCAGAKLELMGRKPRKLAKLARKMNANLSKSEFQGQVPGKANFQISSSSNLSNCNLLIESIPEDPKLKADFFTGIVPKLPSDAIIASNTSSIPISTFIEHVANPERLLGIHFYAPMEKRPLAEIIPTAKTSPECLAQTLEWMRAAGRIPIVAKDSPGFIGNRIFVPYTVEAQHLFGEGYSVALIDEVAHRFGMEVGPYEFVDVVGGETADSVLTSMINCFGEDSRMACPRWGEKCRRWTKLLGRSLSFYQPLGLGRMLRVHSNLLDIRPVRNIVFGTKCSKILREKHTEVDLQELEDRIILPMVNEAFRYVSESDKDREFEKRQIDLAMIYGYGFPAEKKGLFPYVEERGVKDIVRRLEDFSKRFGKRFEPCSGILASKK